MNNPFEYNQENLTTGFYYDKSKNLICFYYYQEETEQSYAISKVHNINNESSNRFAAIMSSNVSRVEDLVTLDVNLFENRDNLVKDFNWLYNNVRICESFIQFLLQEEMYEVLDLFYVFANTKEKQKHGTRNHT